MQIILIGNIKIIIGNYFVLYELLISNENNIHIGTTFYRIGSIHVEY